MTDRLYGCAQPVPRHHGATHPVLISHYDELMFPEALDAVGSPSYDQVPAGKNCEAEELYERTLSPNDHVLCTFHQGSTNA